MGAMRVHSNNLLERLTGRDNLEDLDIDGGYYNASEGNTMGEYGVD
jgi:hypothetical protein